MTKKTQTVKEWSITGLIIFVSVIVAIGLLGAFVWWDLGGTSSTTNSDDTTPTSSSKKSDTIIVPQDAEDIVTALDRVADGGTIVLSEGTYTGTDELNGLTVGILIDKSVTLQGAGRGKTILDGEDTAMHGIYVPEDVDGEVIIRDLTIQNYANNGIEVLANDVEVSGLTIQNNGNRGASFRSTALENVSFHNNIVAENRFNGVFSEKSQVVIANNTIVANGPVGVTIVVADETPDTTSPEIFNNIIVGHTSYGIFYDHPAYVEEVIVDHNNLFDNDEDYWIELNNEGSKARRAVPEPGTGELGLDPEFVDEETYQLETTSPLLETGRDGIEMGAYGGLEQDFDIGTKPIE